MEEPKAALADAEDFEKFQELRHPKSDPVPAKEPPPTPASETASETAAPPEGAETQTQEKKEAEVKPKKDRSLEGRVSELRAAGKHKEADKILRDAWTREANERAENAERELQEFRTRKPAPAEPASAELRAVVSRETEGEPKKADYDGSGHGKMYEDYLADLGAFRAQQRWKADSEKAEQEKSKQANKTEWDKRLTAAKGAHADFDQVANTVNLSLDQQFNALFFHGVENCLDVLYHLGSDPEEVTRLLAMNQSQRLTALAVIGHTLKSPPSQSPPEKLKQPVSKAPPPGRQLGGIEPPPEGSLGDARDFEDFESRRKKRA